MPWAAAIGAAGSIGSGLIGAWGANKAAGTQAQYGQQALSQLQSILGPLISQGGGIVNSASPILQKLLTPGADQTATLSQLPGFKFAQDWGQTAVKNLGTTTGLGGNVLTAGANYATGLAQQGFQGLVGNLQSYLNSGIGLESNAANALAGGTTSALQSIGNSQAAGQLGTANALGGALGGVGNSLSQYALLSKLLGKGGSQNQPSDVYGLNYGDSGNALPTPMFS